MTLHLLGLDPGLTGAIAHIAAGPPPGLRSIHSMPLDADGDLDVVALHCLLQVLHAEMDHDGRPIAYLERVHAMPGDSGSSMFTFGETFGVTYALLIAVGFTVHLVEPALWKRRYHLAGKAGREAAAITESIEAAKRAFPHQPHLFLHGRLLQTKAQAGGKAEAALIARWGLDRELRIEGIVDDAPIAEVVTAGNTKERA